MPDMTRLRREPVSYCIKRLFRRSVNSGLLAIVLEVLADCSTAVKRRAVVVFTEVDLPFAKPIFNRFTQETGIQLRAVYDVKAAKATGLVNRLIAEKKRPQADVLWKNEIFLTFRIQEDIEAHSADRVIHLEGGKVLP